MILQFRLLNPPPGGQWQMYLYDANLIAMPPSGSWQASETDFVFDTGASTLMSHILVRVLDPVWGDIIPQDPNHAMHWINGANGSPVATDGHTYVLDWDAAGVIDIVDDIAPPPPPPPPTTTKSAWGWGLVALGTLVLVGMVISGKKRKA